MEKFYKLCEGVDIKVLEKYGFKYDGESWSRYFNNTCYEMYFFPNERALCLDCPVTSDVFVFMDFVSFVCLVTSCLEKDKIIEVLYR